jgi:thioredoxin reductase
VVATGAQYRRLPLLHWDRLEGVGIYFAATELEAGEGAGGPVFVLGGGNSAGQAALFLARRCTATGEVTRAPARGLFCFIGARPATGWLPAAVERDEDGFVRSVHQYLSENAASS